MERTRMKELRGNRSQLKIALLLGISQQQYCNIENGKRGINPKYFKAFETIFNEKMENLAPDIFLNDNTPKSRNRQQVKEVYKK